MPAEIILQQTEIATALQEKRGQLAVVRARLAEHEVELAELRARLRTFEDRYFRQVGVLYAELDDLEARIAEREVDLYDSDSARHRAEEARQRAEETQRAAQGNDVGEAEVFDPSPNLKALFREVAKRIHPDFARDDAEQNHFTLLMARANQAYRRGDTVILQRLLDDHSEIQAAITGEGDSSELLSIARQIQHAERDVTLLDTERYSLLSSPIAQLHLDATQAEREHRDLLAELASSLRDQLTDARHRFEFVDRQISAHGR